MIASTNNLLSTPHEQRAELPLTDDLAFLSDALGGRLVRGSRNLLAGWPGSGKSRLTTQLALDLSRQGIRSLLILTEETPDRLKERAVQMTSDWPRADAERALAHLQVEAGLLQVAQLPEFLMQQVLNPAGAYRGVQVIILDSIQGEGIAAAAITVYQKVLQFARLCEQHQITTFLLCHVTKSGEMAGPRTLEHGIDASLILRRAMRFTLLHVRKNRYGPPLLRPLPLRIDPVTTRVTLAAHAEARPTAARTFAGVGSGLIEIQAAVAVPADGSRGRTTAPGLPRREIEQLIACLASMDGIDFGELDYRIQCRLPGVGQYQPLFGLPLCLALLGSFLRRPIPEENLYLGEVDLFRNVRPIAEDRLASLRAAIDNGEVPPPLKLFLPSAAAPSFCDSSQLRAVSCRTLEEAVLQTWPDLR